MQKIKEKLRKNIFIMRWKKSSNHPLSTERNSRKNGNCNSNEIKLAQKSLIAVREGIEIYDKTSQSKNDKRTELVNWNTLHKSIFWNPAYPLKTKIIFQVRWIHLVEIRLKIYPRNLLSAVTKFQFL